MKRILYTAIGLSFFATTSALAGGGYITGNVNLRAGPDSSYPSVAMLGAGSAVAIEGCVDGWSWCDVTYGNDRGWVAGNYIQQEYQGQRVLVPAYGVQIGIPIISFSFGPYWDDHYRNRSWYGNRERYSHYTPQYRSIEVHNSSHTTIHENNYGASHVDSHAARATDFRESDRPRQGAPVAVQTSHHATVNAETSQHPVATTRQPERHSVQAKPEVHEPVNHTAPPHAVVAQHNTSQPKVVAEHKVIEPKSSPSKSSEKSPSEHDNGRDKDQH